MPKVREPVVVGLTADHHRYYYSDDRAVASSKVSRDLHAATAFRVRLDEGVCLLLGQKVCSPPG